MSLILDALKQAERENRSRKTPELSVVYQEGETRERRFSVWFWVVVALLANALVVTVAFWPKPHPDRTPADGGARVTAGAPAPSSREAEPQGGGISGEAGAGRVSPLAAEEGRGPTGREPAKGGDAPEVRAPSRPEAIGAMEARKEEKRERADEGGGDSGFAPSEMIPRPETSPAGKQEEVPSAEGSGPVPLVEDLPLETRSKLAAICISGHVYDEDPARSFVFIDGQSFRIGDRIGGDGPVLEAITPDGVILDYGEGKAHVVVAP